MNLPQDASPDQSNVPPDYYRRNNGMLHQIGSQPTTPPAEPLSIPEAATLAGMDKDALVALVMRMARQCGLVATMTREETAQAMLDTLAHTALKPIVLSLNMKADIDSRLKAIDKWLDRTDGKPTQRILQKVEHTRGVASGDMTNDQLMAMLRQADVAGLLPGGTKLIGERLVVDAEYVEFGNGSSMG